MASRRNVLDFQGNAFGIGGRLFRAKWGLGDFPFLFSQLAGFGGWEPESEEPVEVSLWASIRDQQYQVHRMLPHTGMAVLLDIGQPGDIHPTNKIDVGKRLALWALSDTYDRPVAAVSGPLYQDHRIEGRTVRIRFIHAGSGLTAGRKGVMEAARPTGDPIDGFQIRGEEGPWTWAEVRVLNANTLEVFHPKIERPVEVRYGWKNHSPRFQLMNREGLPAATFRTHEQLAR